MEIIKEFGLNPILLAAQIINFLIILFVFKKFLYKPILDVIKKRENSIKEGLLKADEGRLLLEKAKNEEKELLQTAGKRAEKIVEGAKLQVGEMLKQAEEEAKKRGEKLLLDAEAKITQEIDLARKELTKDVGKISVEILEKALQGILTGKEQKGVLERAIRNIKIN